MSEIVLKILEGSGYEDGDVLCAFNENRIKTVHAQHIGLDRDPVTRRIPLLGNGLCDESDLLHDMLETISEYKMIRLSRTEMMMVRMSDLAEIRFESNVPFIGFDGRTVAMDVERYFDRSMGTLRKQNAQGVPIFGTGDEDCHYFSGKREWSGANIVSVWTKIHEKTPLRDTDLDMTEWPEGKKWAGRTTGYVEHPSQALKSHLFVPVVDFSDVEAQALVAPWEEDSGETIGDSDIPMMNNIKRRMMKANNWRALSLGVSEAAILNRNEKVDIRRTATRMADLNHLWHKKEERPGQRIS